MTNNVIGIALIHVPEASDFSERYCRTLYSPDAGDIL